MVVIRSEPALWGDRIFLTSSRNSDFVLLCIRTDGKPLWERTLARAVGLASQKDEGNEGAASPSTDGKHVYSFVWSGAVACHDFEGSEVWKFNAPVQDRLWLPRQTSTHYTRPAWRQSVLPLDNRAEAGG